MADSLLLQAPGERVGAARSAGNLQRIKNEEERALAPVPTLASVCAIVNGTASADFWRPHPRAPALPAHAFFLANQSCSPHESLGRNDSVLPVTHVRRRGEKNPQDSGIWLYFAQGCSDFGWNVGRTLLARNKQDAALMLQERVCACPRAAASRKVAKLVRIHAAKYAASLASRNPASSASPEARIAALLEDAAAGCACRSTCSASRAAKVANTHVYDAKLDIVLRLLLQQLPPAAAIDTIQLWQQPQGYVRDWSLHATELWDVRHLRGWPQVPRYVKEPNRFAFVHRVRRNDGAACKPYEVGCRPGRRIVPYSKIVAPRFSWAPPSYWPCELAEGWEDTCFACRGGVC